MPKPITLPEAMEREVRFVEDTPPAHIVEATLERLRNGEKLPDISGANKFVQAKLSA